MQAFVVEIYWPGVTEGLARELASRVRHVAEAARREGAAVRYLGCTLSPTDEVCYVRVEAASKEVVAEVAGRARLDGARISEVIDVAGA